MTTRSAWVFGALALATIVASVVEGPVRAACCYGRKLTGGTCGPLGGGFQLIGIGPAYLPGDSDGCCQSDTSDTLGQSTSCVTSYVDTTSPPCY